MSRFYIKQICAGGPSVKYSVLSFEDGVNIIYGASNTGKSYVVKCINFMFGSGNGEIPFSKEDTGYDTISMALESDDGYMVSMQRKIVDGKNGETGSGTVSVQSNFPGIDTNDYSISKLEYSDMLLKLMGIKSRHSIINSMEYDTQNLTIRTFFHLFYIDEDNIFRSSSAFDVPKHSKVTASLAALYFLISGNDLMNTVPEESMEEREKKAAQKSGVIIYLSKKIDELIERRNQIEEGIAKDGDVDINLKINELLLEIENIENQILEATEESRQLLERIYTVSSKLEEARYLKDRYASLKSQYLSDIKRLHFIAEGDQRIRAYARLVKCPFCESEIQEERRQKSYEESSIAEYARIQLQIEDLVQAENRINKKIDSLDSELSTLKVNNNDITELISKELRPRALELRNTVESYKRIINMQQEIYALDTMAREMKTDIFEREQEEDSDSPKFNPKKLFNVEIWGDLSEDFETMVHDCGYPNKPAAYISIDSVDAVVGKKKKKNQGKGYRAFLNTIMLFNLMKYLEEKATYAPRLLILDSPILTLKEKKIKLSEKEKATLGMKESLFQYIVDNCGKNQVIIAENEIPDRVDYGKANLIEFSKEKTAGRYGFLLSEWDDEEE